MTNREQVEALLKWLVREAEAVAYGEVGISVTVHGGRITRTAKTVVAKEQS
ncbi:MAG: hypothetical protein AB2L13_10630 [Spirochaetota bacterium]